MQWYKSIINERNENSAEHVVGITANENCRPAAHAAACRLEMCKQMCAEVCTGKTACAVQGGPAMGRELQCPEAVPGSLRREPPPGSH